MFAPGSELGRYRIDGVLGRGGMGIVYRAHDRQLGRTVALKVVLGDAGADDVARLLREARAGASFSHPNAVVVHDVGEIDGVAFVAMEFLAGRPLRAFVGDREIPLARRLRWLVQVARALGAAHRAGIVHRDVKPENVIVRDEDLAAKVVDFGIARTVRSRVPEGDDPTENAQLGTITRGDVVIGTPLYMAPEQLRAEQVDARADQFAWGVMAYELVTGRYPWKAEGLLQLAASIASKDPAPMRDGETESLPQQVEHAVLRAMSAERERRFATMDDLADSLETDPAPPSADPVPAAVPSEPAPPDAPPPSPLRPSPGRRRWLVAVLAVAGLAGMVAIIASGGGQSPTLPVSPAASSAAISPPSPSAFGPLDAPMPTSTPQALAEYRAGLARMREASWADAVPHIERAIELDPELGAAHVRRLLMQLAVPGSDAARSSFREATRRADRMLPRDRALLEALGPAFADPPAMAVAAARLVAASDAAPGDAELALLAASVVFHRSEFAETVRLAERALAADRGYADAWQIAAIGHAALGAWDRAEAALQTCIELVPSALDCKMERGHVLAARGRCQEAERVARDTLSIQPGLRNATALLANARFLAGDEDASITGVLRAGVQGLPPAAVRYQHARLESGLAVVRGRFQDAVAIAEGAAPPELRERDVRDVLALTIAWSLVEMGEPERARSAARTYLASTGAMIPPSLDLSPFLRVIAGQPDPRPAPDFAATVLPSLSWAAWAWPGATDAAAAARLVEARPALPTRKMLTRSLALHAFEARLLMLAGRTDEARPLLEAAAQTCHVLEEPFASTWANAWLGELLEAAGDQAAACDAYRVVVHRWGAVERSPTARSARQALARLRCGEGPRRGDP